MELNILQCNPKANYLTHKDEIDAAINRVLDSGRYILDEEVEAFEMEFKEFLGATHAVGVASGTDALELALRACGIGQGDTVVTVSCTAVATVSAIERTGALPLFVDVDPQTYTMSPDSLETLLKRLGDSKPCAIIPVHLYGHPADLPAILSLSEKYGLYVIEDCAQAHGASFSDKKVGTWGHLGTFSFYPTKNLGALGDGGMVVTNDSQLAKQVKILRQYGWEERNMSSMAGLNSRLDELQAAVLRVKLKYLNMHNEKRFCIASEYAEHLQETRLRLPITAGETQHVFHQYAVCSESRDALRSSLAEKGIGTSIHYPTPIHLQPAYLNRIPLTVSLDNTENIAREIFSLPMFPELSKEDVGCVIRELLVIAHKI